MAKITDQQVCKAMGTKGIKAAYARLAYLGFTRPCGRCGGSGHYSRNAAGSTVCYDCNGAATVLVALTETVLKDAAARVTSGALEPYMAKVRARAAAEKAIAPALAELRLWLYPSSELEGGLADGGIREMFRAGVTISNFFMGVMHQAGVEWYAAQRTCQLGPCAPELCNAHDFLFRMADMARDAASSAERGRIDPQVALETVTTCLELVKQAHTAWREMVAENA